jgi:transcriptional regulator with GAF, ATPase, and Fis domain
VELVAPTDANVLVLGESGTGKELIATAIHERSARKGGPMVRVNCAAIPADLFESEFFGHARGAFTGAAHERVGRFELAAGGTLFLDEVAEIPRPLQGKLLRALQERTFERVGENRTRTVDVRVVAATNKDLAREVREGRFREDLMFRLGVFPIELPPLRARIDDVTPLAAHFLRQVCARQKREPLALTPALVRTLEEYPWPGNVRELQNVIERAVILSPKGRLRLDLALPQARFPSVMTSKHKGAVLTDAELRTLERDNLIAALAQCEGRVSGPEGAAALLGIKPTTLASRMKVMKVKPH